MLKVMQILNPDFEMSLAIASLCVIAVEKLFLFHGFLYYVEADLAVILL